MRFIVKTCAMILALSLWAGTALAETDFQLWLEGGLSSPLTKNLQLRFDLHLRLDNNAQNIKSFIPDLSLRYKIVSWFRVTGGYRFIAEPMRIAGVNHIDIWHRFYADALFRYRFWPVKLGYRIRFQEQLGSPLSSGMKYKHTIRNRGKIAFDLGKGFEPYVAGEVFIRIDDPDGIWHKWRATIGMVFAYTTHEVGVLWRSEGKLNNSNDPILSILGLSYHYNF